MNNNAFPSVAHHAADRWEFADYQLCLTLVTMNNQFAFECADSHLTYSDRIYEFGVQRQEVVSE